MTDVTVRDVAHELDNHKERTRIRFASVSALIDDLTAEMYALHNRLRERESPRLAAREAELEMLKLCLAAREAELAGLRAKQAALQALRGESLS